MEREKYLLQEIEKLRDILNNEAKTKSLISKEMISYSHKLDILLNEFEQIHNQKQLKKTV
ncbi:aspartyl-phosphate phosphatase Spo0E family protein [Halalkalibacter akibai]|uniref:Aspartyl-phosphate phosphatase Spo0E family protein n=1 Tax=Halalkalibacter akibai (strain ATCC 43226 / DSM 21942 / CIP 109018 / JCM 9157 / 1139) TaxID=1236973 RepID=W4QYB4_HALA3|nr:aspartyl-phosphate phosphatase Spo0E family protein [Halalkalibacter akibai]GAE37125.1 hypothetical protein JCM9157_4373 [Halalkalibacter akibai JCM 9157]